MLWSLGDVTILSDLPCGCVWWHFKALSMDMAASGKPYRWVFDEWNNVQKAACFLLALECGLAGLDRGCIHSYNHCQVTIGVCVCWVELCLSRLPCTVYVLSVRVAKAITIVTHTLEVNAQYTLLGTY